jgi:hypothetical protein
MNCRSSDDAKKMRYIFLPLTSALWQTWRNTPDSGNSIEKSYLSISELLI